MARSAITIGFLVGFVVLILTLNARNVQSQQIKRALRIAPEEAVRQLSNGIRNFTIELLYHTASNQGNHLVISPFSVWALLAIITEGASGNTFLELATKLRLPIDQEVMRVGYQALEKLFNVNTPTVELATVSRLYTSANRQINIEFESIINEIYKAAMMQINFRNVPQALKQINGDVSRATRGKITEIVQADDLLEAQMIITNAVFFKGQWALPFDKKDTEKAPFFDEHSKQIGVVNMMYAKGPYAFINLKKFQAFILELPYGKEKRLSMLIMLPYAKIDLKKMFQNLAVVSLEELFDKLREAADELEDDEVEIWLPRFKIETDVVMNKPLNDLGIFEVFDPNLADLPLIARNTYVSRVIHKAVIEVTEEGTVASAATAGMVYDRSFPPKFQADRPFAYLIVEKTTNIIVFAGIYSKPAEF